MREIENEVERAYRELIASGVPYTKISVLSICDRAGVTRKVFYKCFKGKDDVLRRAFDRDVVAPQVELCRILSFEKMAKFAPNMERHIFEAVHDDGAFYQAVVSAPQGGEEAFSRMAVAAFTKFNRIMLAEYGYAGTEVKIDYVAAYFAEAKARMLVKWIREGFPLSSEDAADLYSRMALPFWGGMLG